jgi:hypothetical protein
VKWLPIDGVKNRDIWPVMVPLEILLVLGKATKTADLSGEVMSDGNSANLEAARARREEGDGGKMVRCRSKEVGSYRVTAYIELDGPREVLEGDSFILVTKDMVERNRSRKGSKHGEDL